ncbi:MAG: UbiD family decarboxylase, partial [Chloroflexi bacterium]|nr:UbiD family decarboxylase [Chloroflexota bacterium]
MSSYKDLREFIRFLDRKGELRRIKTPVSSELEITEIASRVITEGGPALLFENVDGGETPVLINMFGTHQRVAWALGVENVEEITERVRKLLGLTQGPPAGIVNKIRTVGDLAGLARSRPKIIKNAPCQEIVLTGEDADVSILPILKCWPLDAGPYITLPLVISRDPTSGRRNVGTYRMQVYDGKTMGMHWQTHKVGARHYRDGEERRLERLDVAVALGGDPTTI